MGHQTLNRLPREWREHTPGAKAPIFKLIVRAKAEALAYLEARAQTYLEARAQIRQNVSYAGVVIRGLTRETGKITR